jgi:hypothetical protein
MKFFLRYFLSFTLALASTFANAQTVTFDEGAHSILLLGAQNSSSQAAYVTFVQPLQATCQFGIVYVPNQALYALLLAAFTSGRQLVRVNYTQTGGAGTEFSSAKRIFECTSLYLCEQTEQFLIML